MVAAWRLKLGGGRLAIEAERVHTLSVIVAFQVSYVASQILHRGTYFQSRYT